MAFYDDMAEVAADLLAEFGAPVTLRRRSGGTFDPATETVTGETMLSVATTGVVRAFRADLIDGTRVQRGDRQIVLDASTAPQMADRVLIGTALWGIVDIETVSPAGTPVCYVVHIRQ